MRSYIVSKGSAVVSFPIAIPEGKSVLQHEFEIFEVQNSKDKIFDRLTVTQKIVPVFLPEIQDSVLFQLNPVKTLPTKLDKTFNKDKSFLRVSLFKNISQDRSGLISFADQYEFNCLEQRISKAVIKNDLNMWESISRELANYQTSSGLLTFYPKSEGKPNLELTGYIAQITSRAKFHLPVDVQKNMTQGLQNFIKTFSEKVKPTLEDKENAILAANALAALEITVPEVLKALEINVSELNSQSLLEYAEFCLRTRNEVELSKSIAVLKAKMIVSGTSVRLTAGRNNASSIFFDKEVEMLKFSQLASDLPAGKNLDANLIFYSIVKDKPKSGHYMTTVGNALAAVLMRDFEKLEAQNPVKGKTSVSIGQKIQVLDWDKKENVIKMPFPEEKSELELKHLGVGTPWANVETVVLPIQPKNIVKGFRLNKKSIEKKSYKVGDVMTVNLQIQAKQNFGMCALLDPLPSGSTLIEIVENSTLLTKVSYREINGEAIRLYLDELPEGFYSLTYKIRLNQAGDYLLGLSQMVELYHPENYGTWVNGNIIVNDSPITLQK